MRILNLIDIPWNSGLASYAFDQARALKAAGHAVYFACPDGSAAREFAGREGFVYFPLPDRKEPFLRLPFLKLKKILAVERIDIISAHTGKTQTLAFLLSFFSAKKTAVIRTKADARPPSKNFSFMKVSKIIAASDFIRKGYLKLGFAPEKIERIYQGIHLPAVTAKKQGPPYRIGILGRLDPVKGHADFLRAAALLRKKRDDLEFMIAGYESGIKYPQLRAFAHDLGLTGKVSFLGRVAKPAAFMAGCDIGVIASAGSEAVSRAALEWLAASRPVIATAVGSLGEFIEPEFLVPPSNPEALAEKIEDILKVPHALQSTGALNRQKAENMFSFERFAKATERIFLEAAPGSR